MSERKEHSSPAQKAKRVFGTIKREVSHKFDHLRYGNKIHHHHDDDGHHHHHHHREDSKDVADLSLGEKTHAADARSDASSETLSSSVPGPVQCADPDENKSAEPEVEVEKRGNAAIEAELKSENKAEGGVAASEPAASAEEGTKPAAAEETDVIVQAPVVAVDEAIGDSGEAENTVDVSGEPAAGADPAPALEGSLLAQSESAPAVESPSNSETLVDSQDAPVKDAVAEKSGYLVDEVVETDAEEAAQIPEAEVAPIVDDTATTPPVDVVADSEEATQLPAQSFDELSIPNALDVSLPEVLVPAVLVSSDQASSDTLVLPGSYRDESSSTDLLVDSSVPAHTPVVATVQNEEVQTDLPVDEGLELSFSKPVEQSPSPLVVPLPASPLSKEQVYSADEQEQEEEEEEVEIRRRSGVWFPSRPSVERLFYANDSQSAFPLVSSPASTSRPRENSAPDSREGRPAARPLPYSYVPSVFVPSAFVARLVRPSSRWSAAALGHAGALLRLSLPLLKLAFFAWILTLFHFVGWMNRRGTSVVRSARQLLWQY